MRSLPRLVIVCAVALGATLAGGTLSASAAGCSSTCSVGGAGNGGESSGGAAQGFNYQQQPLPGLAGATVSNSGNQIGGNITVTGTASGMAGGAYTPQEVVVGHYTGFVAQYFGMPGPCNGVCG